MCIIAIHTHQEHSSLSPPSQSSTDWERHERQLWRCCSIAARSPYGPSWSSSILWYHNSPARVQSGWTIKSQRVHDPTRLLNVSNKGSLHDCFGGIILLVQVQTEKGQGNDAHEEIPIICWWDYSIRCNNITASRGSCLIKVLICGCKTCLWGLLTDGKKRSIASPG